MATIIVGRPSAACSVTFLLPFTQEFHRQWDETTGANGQLCAVGFHAYGESKPRRAVKQRERPAGRIVVATSIKYDSNRRG
jgi:hypothetical protein